MTINTIKRIIIKGIFIAFISLWAISAAPVDVHGHSASAAAWLPIKQIFIIEQGNPPTDVFSYSLTALESGNPLPEGGSNGVYAFTFTGNEEKNIGPITFTTEGTYKYLLCQVVDQPVEGYVYDMREYYITIYVKTGIDGKLLTQVIVGNQAGQKIASPIEFENRYSNEGSTETPANPDTPETPDTPENNLNKDADDNPPAKTGDSSNVALWMVILLDASAAILYLSIRKKQ